MWLLYPGTCHLILGHEVCWSRQSKSILVAVPERTVGARESRSLPFWNRSGALTSFYPCSQESHTLHQSQFGTGIFPCEGRERTEGEKGRTWLMQHECCPQVIRGISSSFHTGFHIITYNIYFKWRPFVHWPHMCPQGCGPVSGGPSGPWSSHQGQAESVGILLNLSDGHIAKFMSCSFLGLELMHSDYRNSTLELRN